MHRTRSGRRLAAIAVVVLAVLGLPSSAMASTDFDYSLPTDGASVGRPVSEIAVAFSDVVTLVGPGFEVLDPQGRLVQPFAVTDDDRVFRLQLDPPLAGGEVSVHWEVAARDGRVLSGSFSFTVSVEAPTTSVTTIADTTSTTVPPISVTLPPTTETTSTAATDPGTVASDRVDTAGGRGDSPDDNDDGNLAGDGGDGGPTGLVVAVLVAVAAGAFLVVRSRRT